MSRYVVQAGWDDVPHLTAAMKAKLLYQYPEYQRDARTKGKPQLGAGAIYRVPESEFVVKPFAIPVYFRKSYGLDVGWKMTACVWGAHDPDADVVYLYSEHRVGQNEPSQHAMAIRGRGAWIPGVIDPAARGRGQNDGQRLLQNYLDLGLLLTPADNAVEAGLYEVWERLASGRLKVFDSLVGWLGEYRTYQRDLKGHVVKENDHSLDATRYLLMSGIQQGIVNPQYLEKLGHVAQNVSTHDPHAEAYEG